MGAAAGNLLGLLKNCLISHVHSYNCRLRFCLFSLEVVRMIFGDPECGSSSRRWWKENRRVRRSRHGFFMMGYLIERIGENFRFHVLALMISQLLCLSLRRGARGFLRLLSNGKVCAKEETWQCGSSSYRGELRTVPQDGAV